MSRLTFAAAAAALLCQRLAADHAREAMRGARRVYHPVEIAIGRVLSLPLMVMPDDLAWPDPLRFGWRLERAPTPAERRAKMESMLNRSARPMLNRQLAREIAAS